MSVFEGLKYNVKGVVLAFKTPKLLMLGILRFFIVLFLTVLVSGLVLYWHADILNLIWRMPDQGGLIVLWKVVSWILSIVLAVISMVLAYLIAQVLFCVFIMDYMSRITETMVRGKEAHFEPGSWVGFFLHLIKQEFPRAILPVLISLIIMMVGLLTPVSPVIIVISSIVAAMFLAWDNTDLIPARRMVPFKIRLKFLTKNLWFHVGFGLPFLVPGLNMVFLSFAPVGATLYYLDKEALTPCK
jgi:CysZ protein